MGIGYLALLALVALSVGTPSENTENVKARFDNYKVYRVIPNSDEQITKLQEIEAGSNELSFWRSAAHKGKPADIMVPPHKLPEAHNLLKALGLKHEVIVEDVQRLTDEVHPNQRQVSDVFDWKDYHRLDSIYAWLDDLAAQNPDRISIVTGGKTFEDRIIKGVKYSTGGAKKPVIFMDGGIHACEWISPAVHTFILNQVVSNQDPEVRALVDSFDWYFFPVINPDGYEYAHVSDRMWRKTRGNGNLLCKGIDANRNWGYHWGSAGGSDDPCSNNYHGTGPFSEIETTTLSQFISTIADDLVMYISFHSYSQLIVFPMGYTDVHLPDYDHMMAVGNRSAKAIQTRYGTEFVAGNIVDLLYEASGNNLDWVKGTYNTSLTYVFELRDQGHFGFLLPADQIIPSGEETFDGIISLVKDAQKLL